jgi:hypothetical protein
VTHDVEQQLLELDDFGSGACSRLPPSVGVEPGVVRESNRDSRPVTLHRTTEDSPETPRVVRRAHHHHGTEHVLIAPAGKQPTFVLGSGYTARHLPDVHDAKRLELSNGSCSRIIVREAPADELAIDFVRGVGKHRDTRGDTAAHQVGRFQHPGAAGINRHDDDVGWLERIIDNEGPAGGPQNRCPDGARTGGDSAHEHADRQYQRPPRPPSEHVLP